MDELQSTFNAIISKTKAKGRGNQYKGVCPGHDDQKASLSIKYDTTGIAIYCQAGCQFKNIIPLLGFSPRDCFPMNAAPDYKPRKREVCRYDYVDSNSNLLYQIVRFDPKDFRPVRPGGNGKGSEIWDLQGVERVPYHLPKLLRAIANNQIILFVEGEKDADAAIKLGFNATTIVGGAGKWRPEYRMHFKDANLVLLPDNDEPGRRGMDLIAKALNGSAKRIRILNLPNLPPKGDLSDWIDQRHTAGELQELIYLYSNDNQSPDLNENKLRDLAKNLLNDFAPPQNVFDTSLLPPSLAKYIDQNCRVSDTSPLMTALLHASMPT